MSRILHFWSDMRNSTTQNLEPHKYYYRKTYKLEIEKFVFLYDFLSSIVTNKIGYC